jgi:hypothetical protein
MDAFIRDRIEVQVKDRMKDDRLVAAEVTDKVFKNLKYSASALLACIALLGYLGYSNLKQGIEPLTKEAQREAESALDLARQAQTQASKNAKEVSTFSASSQQQMQTAKAHADQVENTVNTASRTITAKLNSLENTAGSLDKQLKTKADQLQAYESRVSSIDNHLAQLAVNQQFPGVGAPSLASVSGHPIVAADKKAGQKYLVFNLTSRAVSFDLLKPEDIAQLERALERRGFRVFGGTPAYGKIGAASFVAVPFKDGNYENGVWVQYFGVSNKEAAQQVHAELSKYIKVSSAVPELVSEQDSRTREYAAAFIKESGIDVYVELAPPR